MSWKFISIVGAFVTLLGGASGASADVVSIGLQEAGINGGSITNESSGTGSAIFAGIYGTFGVSIISGFGVTDAGGHVLNSESMNTSSSTSGVLTVYLTDQGLTSVSGIERFISNFSTNIIPAGFEVTEQTYLDNNDGVFTDTPGNLLNSVTFEPSNSPQFSTQSVYADIAGSPEYSVTEVYEIHSDGVGNVNSNIDLTIPEPASMALLGSGLLGMGMIGWRRRRKRS